MGTPPKRGSRSGVIIPRRRSDARELNWKCNQEWRQMVTAILRPLVFDCRLYRCGQGRLEALDEVLERGVGLLSGSQLPVLDQRLQLPGGLGSHLCPEHADIVLDRVRVTMSGFGVAAVQGIAELRHELRRHDL